MEGSSYSYCDHSLQAFKFAFEACWTDERAEWEMDIIGSVVKCLKSLRSVKWLGNIRDWCISRQFWGGHRVPAWYVTLEDDEVKKLGVYDDHWLVARDEQEAQAEAAMQFAGKKFRLCQDLDVLETWFSSGCFPLSALGWLDDTVINGITLEGLRKRLEEGNLDPKELAIDEVGQTKDFPKGIAECNTLLFALVSYTAQGKTFETHYLRTNKDPGINFEVKVSRVKSFSGFYGKEWPHRRLRWLHSLGSCEVTANFKSAILEMLVTTSRVCECSHCVVGSLV
ncbi:hypothetical protein CRG98_040654 [Punica granatum]|uniref:valine--tRNA ligase n=1 Tax=Punica granatum TaxID=22663 RepID=A0A2I0I6A4_PUNGR|nr:hypothetical protein CRG98_040654 [Punica granatum]